MISWNPNQVATFLGCEPVLPHSEKTEVEFGFRLRGMFGRLIVHPFNDEILIRLSRSSEEEYFAEWRHRCLVISVVSDAAIDLDAALVLEARIKDVRLWIRIDKDGNVFTINSYSLFHR